MPNFFRKPYGPGWALVGDAGYNKDFITALGINDAFRDAELCADALDQTFAGRRPFNEAMATYQSARDGMSCRCTNSPHRSRRSSPRLPTSRSCSSAVSQNQEAMDDFVRVTAGVTSPAEFYSETNVGRIIVTTIGVRAARPPALSESRGNRPARPARLPYPYRRSFHAPTSPARLSLAPVIHEGLDVGRC